MADKKKHPPSVAQHAKGVTGPVLQVGGDASHVSIAGPNTSAPPTESTESERFQCFLTHLTEEEPIAKVLKDYIESVGGKRTAVFLAESPDSIGIGKDWMDEIHSRLAAADLLIILASPKSIARPWVNIETGAAWIQGKRFLSLCHSGLNRDALPQPYQSRQSYDLINPRHLEAFFASLRESVDAGPSLPLDFSAMAKTLTTAIQTVPSR